MKYIIFDFQKDLIMIDSFLKSASTAHKQSIRTQDWFLWKFRDNPFGESILACAVSDNNVVGCVALGMQDFLYMGNPIKGAISFETFVHPDYQGQGIFKKLITLAEKEAQHRKIKFLLNFPNSNSLPGFIRSGWSQLHIGEYWIKPRNILRTVINLAELRKAFIPNASNFTDLKNCIKENSIGNRSVNPFLFKSKITNEYLQWRFFAYPNSEYKIVESEHYLSIARLGKRGRLKEVQILFIENLSAENFSIKNIIKSYKSNIDFDLISLPISTANIYRRQMISNLFIKVPNKSNITYKILDNTVLNFKLLQLSAINYHTY